MWRYGKELGKGEEIYSMRPSEMQCNGDIKTQETRILTRFVAYRSRGGVFLVSDFSASLGIISLSSLLFKMPLCVI